MDQKKYIGLDVHQASISVAVRDATGKLITESIIETKATTILEFIRGIRGSLWITFEEGTSAAWLYDLLKPHVTKVIVCNPRKNALLNAGSKSDRVDARKLSDLLRAGLLTPVYHGENGVRTLRELGRSYITVTKDLTRVMNRVKGSPTFVVGSMLLAVSSVFWAALLVRVSQPEIHVPLYGTGRRPKGEGSSKARHSGTGPVLDRAGVLWRER